MSKQEILSWTSLVTSLSFIVLYLIFVFGWPNFLPDYGNRFFDIFFNLFWIALVIEIFVEAGKKKGRVEKDERDFKIEAHGNKNAYNFLSIAIAFFLVSVFLSTIFGRMIPVHSWIAEPEHSFHILLVFLFASNITKRVTQIYYYKTIF